MRTTVTVLVTLLALGCASAFAPGQQPATPPLRMERTAALEAFVFEAQSGERSNAFRGEIFVQENRSDPSSRMIRLRFVLFPATTSDPGPPIVYLAGGPGGSGIGAALGPRFPLFMALRGAGDVIAFDQRGTGRSEPDLGCGKMYFLPFDRPFDPDLDGAILAREAAACAATLREGGADLSGYTTLESAADLDALRQELGAETLRLWGISYGTHLALAMMKAYPASVDGAILAGLEPLDATLKLPSDQQALLESIADLVRADPTVADAVPDLTGSIGRLVRELEGRPRTVHLVNPLNRHPMAIVVGANDLRQVLAGMLRGPEEFALMPDLVARLERGDWITLALFGRRIGPVPSMMALAIDCASGASPAWERRIDRESASTLLRDAINFPFPEICRGLGIPDAGESFRRMPRLDHPVLMISGTLDGRTPPANAERILPLLPHATHLVIEGAGHSDPLFLSSPRILDAMLEFLEKGTTTTHRIALPPVQFVAPREVVDLAPEQLVRFAGTYRIAEDDVRHVIPGGPVLFTVRGQGPPSALRPLSPTRFFWEATVDEVEFELDDAGNPVAMVTNPHTEHAERAVRVE